MSIDTQNAARRVPVALVLDCSFSMAGDPINAVNNGIRQFDKEIRNSTLLTVSNTLELTIISFGGEVKVLQPFQEIDAINQLPDLTAVGGTPMGEAVKKTLSLLKKRKEQYRKHGIEYWQPIMVLMTDGVPTDDIDEAVSLIQQDEGDDKLVVILIAIGDGANEDELARFSTKGGIYRLNSFGSFPELMRLIGMSISGSITGGTGNVAEDIHTALNECGIDDLN